MSFTVENLEKSMVKFTIEVGADVFEKACDSAYQKNKGKINGQGFRKGKAPRSVIEKMYGAGVFFEDAANEVIPVAYSEAADESKLTIVSRPEIDVVTIEKGKPFVFTATVAVRPEVKLGAYKGIEVEAVDAEVTEEEIEAEINRVREQQARIEVVEGQPVASGDIAVIDYEGFVDGVPFEGGKGENYNLTIGSHSFIDTFEDQLIGKNSGDEVEVNVTFPEEYHAKELAGKPALFKVKVNEIKKKELPEVDDDFASEVSDFDTLAEYKEDLKKSIGEKKAADAKTKKEDAIIEKIIEASEMEIADAFIDAQAQQMAEDTAMRMQQQGISLDMYFKFTGLTPEGFMATLKPQALKRIQYRLGLEEVGKAEGLDASDADVDAEIERMAQNYQMELDQLKQMMTEKDKETIKMDLSVQKAIDFVYNNAK